MTTLRRFTAVFLILVLIPVLLVAVIVAQVNATVLSAGFYVRQMDNADLYNFAYDEVLPAALDELAQDADTPESLRPARDRIIAIGRAALPPEWLEEQSEAAIIQIVPYVTGAKDEFLITVPLREPLEKIGKGIKDIASDPGIYAFIVDDTVAPQMEKALQERGALPLGIRVTGKDLVTAFKTVAPQDWVAGAIGQTVDQTVPYVTGKSDSFAIVIPIRERVEAAGPALKTLLRSSGAYSALENPELSEEIQKQLDGFGAQPFGLTLTGEHIAGLVRQVVTSEWVRTQGESTIDQVVPYLAGRQDRFVVTIPLRDRVLAAQPAFKKLLNDTGSYRQVRDEIVRMVVARSASDAVSLQVGVTVAPEDIRQMLQGALSDEFVRQQTDALVDSLFPYLAGETRIFRVDIPLEASKRQALDSLESLVREKARALWNGLPACTFSQAADLLRRTSFDSIPSCRPAGFSLEEMKRAMNITDQNVTEQDIADRVGVEATLLTQGVTFDWLEDKFSGPLREQVEDHIGTAIPNTFTYTETDLRATLSPEAAEKLDTVLTWGREGYAYTDADLRETLGGDASSSLDSLRTWARDGFRYSDKDLESAFGTDNPEGLATYKKVLEYTRNGLTFSQTDLRQMMDGDAGGDSASASLDSVRDSIGKVRDLQWLAYLVPLLLIAGAAFLGGRDLRGRLAWGSAALGIAAFVAVFLFGIVYSLVAWPLIEDVFQGQAAQASGVQRLMMDKAFEIVESMSEAIVGGMAWASAFLLAVAIAGFVTAAFLPQIKKALLARGASAGPEAAPQV